MVGRWERGNPISKLNAKIAIADFERNRHYLFKNIHRPHFNIMAVKRFDRLDEEDAIGRVFCGNANFDQTQYEQATGRLFESDCGISFSLWIACIRRTFEEHAK